jgi:hypothetical protein
MDMSEDIEVMRLIGAGGDTLALAVVGYQFPEADDPMVRYSWYMVEGEATQGGAHWRFRWQALACDEAPLVSKWLREAAGHADTPEQNKAPVPLKFTEPILRFELLERSDSSITLAVRLDMEFRLPGVQRRAAENPTVLVLEVCSADLWLAADAFESGVAQFPDGWARPGDGAPRASG